MSDVKVGQIWIDKDKRMSGRAVKVTHIDAKNGWVRYSRCNPNGVIVCASLNYRAMLKRFPKAFRIAVET